MRDGAVLLVVVGLLVAAAALTLPLLTGPTGGDTNTTFTISTGATTTAPTTTSATTTTTAPGAIDSRTVQVQVDCNKETPYLRVEALRGKIVNISVVYDTGYYGPESATLATQYLLVVRDGSGNLVYSGYMMPVNQANPNPPYDALEIVDISGYCTTPSVKTLTFTVEIYAG